MQVKGYFAVVQQSAVSSVRHSVCDPVSWLDRLSRHHANPRVPIPGLTGADPDAIGWIDVMEPDANLERLNRGI